MCVCVCVCVCGQDLAFNNPQGLISSKTQPSDQPIPSVSFLGFAGTASWPPTSTGISVKLMFHNFFFTSLDKVELYV